MIIRKWTGEKRDIIIIRVGMSKMAVMTMDKNLSIAISKEKSRKFLDDWKDKVVSKEFLEECDSMSNFIKDMTN